MRACWRAGCRGGPAVNQSTNQSQYLLAVRILPQALDVLGKMLTFHPEQRITAEQALAHPFFDMFRGTGDERVAASPFSFAFESNVSSTSTIKAMFLREIARYHPEILTRFPMRSDEGVESK